MRWTILYFQRSARLKQLIVNRACPEAQCPIKQKLAEEANFLWQIFWARRSYSIVQAPGPEQQCYGRGVAR
jgi:hypothetical protein